MKHRGVEGRRCYRDVDQEVSMRADLDTGLLRRLLARSAQSVAPGKRRRRGQPGKITDNEVITLMVAQMLLRTPRDRRFLVVAGWRLRQLFAHLPSQSRYNERTRALTPKLVALWWAIACELPASTTASACSIHLLPCGQSVKTTQTSELAPWCAAGWSVAHSRFYRGMRVLLCGPGGCVRDFDLVPANAEREGALELLERQPLEGQLIICDKGLFGREFEDAVRELGVWPLRPSRADELERPNPPISWIRQRIESIIQTPKGQLLLEEPLAKTPEGLCCRIAATILALCAAIHLNWQLGRPPRAIAVYGH